MRVFFHLLYHSFAFSYDFVAAAVSLGRWQDWVKSVIPWISGSPVLEIGYGSGHLQLELRSLGISSIGLDESRQMGLLAGRRMKSNGFGLSQLTRGVSKRLPFCGNSFNTIISTFPSEYIYEKETLKEIQRVLIENGRLIVLPAAWHVGRGVMERLLAYVFRVTGESPGPFEVITGRMKSLIESAGFKAESHKLVQGSSLLLLIIATK